MQNCCVPSSSYHGITDWLCEFAPSPRWNYCWQFAPLNTISALSLFYLAPGGLFAFIDLLKYPEAWYDDVNVLKNTYGERRSRALSFHGFSGEGEGRGARGIHLTSRTRRGFMRCDKIAHQHWD
jgi:hypothetical protein